MGKLLQHISMLALQGKWSLTTLLMLFYDVNKRRYLALRRFEKHRQSVAYVRVEMKSADAF